MNAQAPSCDALANESIVIVDGQRRNVSNLVICRRQSVPEPSLYPAVSDLPTLETTDQAFRRAQKRASSSRLKDKWSADLASQEDDEKDQESTDLSPQKDERIAVSHNRQMIEVTPGFWVPVCGAAETMQAVDRGDIQNVVCLCCNLRLLVIFTASMVVCPECDMISSLSGVGDGSLGLGLREATLQKDESGEHNEAVSEDTPLTNIPLETKDLHDEK